MANIKAEQERFVIALVAMVLAIFISGCAKTTNTVTIYEFKDDYEAGVEISENMFTTRQIDIAEGFVSSYGVVYTPETMDGMRLVTPDNWSDLVGDKAYLNQSGRKGGLLRPYHITNKPVNIDVLRLRKNVEAGTEITADHLEVVSVKRNAVPSGIIVDPNLCIGKYAAFDLLAGDYLTDEKLTGEDMTAPTGNRVSLSVPISSFAGHLSGKLQAGDIVRFYVQAPYGTTFAPNELQWVEIVSVTMGGGIDQNEAIENEDEPYEMPSTVTVLVNETQARILAEHAATSDIHLSLIYRGTTEKAQEYLKLQDEILNEKNQ